MASSNAIANLHNRIDLTHIPFTDRGSRLLIFRKGHHLYIRLAERWAKWEEEMGHYRLRPPIIERFAFLGADGAPLTELATDTYPHVAQIRTAVGSFDWVFVDPESLLVRLPTGRYGFEFEVYAAREGRADRRGGTLHGKRNVGYTTNARLIHNEVTQSEEGRFRVKLLVEADEGNALLINITPRLAFNRSIPVPDALIAEARLRWQAWFDAVPPVLDEYRKQYDYAWWIMRAGLLNTRYFFTREALLPSKIHYVGVWHWDQFFHALAYRHVDMKLAEDQIRILLDHQRPDGMIPDAIHDEGLITHLEAPVDADVTKPPLMAWTVLKLFEKSGHRDFLEEVYEPLKRWHDWWTKYNMNADGLAEYRHPFSSGLDDSPLWDEGMPVVSPDLNTYLCIQKDSIAQLADLIGEHEVAEQYRRERDQLLERMIAVLWDEAQGTFRALYHNRPIPVLTPFNLLPLWTGRLPEAIAKRLIAHLTDPATFWPEWPIPTVAVSDPKFNPKQMWRGPTWVNINYLFVDALTRIGQHELAGLLRRKSLELVMQHPDIYEYYDPLTAERPPKAAPIFGWTSAVFIDMAIQETHIQQERKYGWVMR